MIYANKKYPCFANQYMNWKFKYSYIVEDKCAPSPCQNGGSCVNTLSSFDGGFSCECDKGWTGDTCTEGNYALDNDAIIELNFIITSKYSNLFISRTCFYL